MTHPVTPSLTFLTHLSVEVGTPVDLGDGPDGHRRLVPILGGRVRGPGLTGTVAAAGVDHQWLRSPTATELEATYAIDTEDGARITVHNSGLRVGSPADIDRLIRDEPVDPANIYFRTLPRLRSADPRWAHLTDRLFVATGVRTPATVELDVFEVG